MTKVAATPTNCHQSLINRRNCHDTCQHARRYRARARALREVKKAEANPRVTAARSSPITATVCSYAAAATGLFTPATTRTRRVCSLGAGPLGFYSVR